MNVAPNVQPSPRFPVDKIVALYAQLGGVQVTLSWQKQPLKGQVPSTEKAWIEVDETSAGALGDDEMRAQYNVASNSNTFLLRGDRVITHTLKAKSLDNTLSAWSLLERVRFRLRTDLATTAYRAAGVSIASSGRDMLIRHFDEIIEAAGEDSRKIKVAVMEIRWNWCASATMSPTDMDGGYIQRVNGGTPTSPVPNVGIIPGNLT